MKKIPQLFLLSTLSLGLVSPMLVKAETTAPTETTPTTTIESIPASDSNIIENTTTTTPETTTSASEVGTTESVSSTVSTETVTENTTESTTESSSEESVKPAVYSETVTTESVQLISGIDGDGKSEATAFKAKNYEDFVKIANLVSSKDYYTATNTSTVYIKATQDITFPGTRVEFKDNTNEIIIDGNKTTKDITEISERYSIFYSGSNTGAYEGQFLVSSDNMNMTLENINFGNSQYSNQNYYGFCRIASGKSNVNLNIKNISYYATKGGQPFWASRGSTVNYLNFYGNNDFGSYLPATSSQEFTEGFSTVTFKEKSNTKIYHETGTGWFFRPDLFNGLILEDNSTVDISTDNREFIGDATGTSKRIIKLGENSYFRLNRIGNNTTNKFTYTANTVSVDLQKNSQFILLTPLTSFSYIYLNITATDPKLISFSNSGPSANAIASSSSLKILNNDTSIYTYKTDSIISLVEEDKELEDENVSKYKNIVYQPAMTVGDLTATPYSSAGISEIDSQLANVTNYLDSSYTVKTQYYVTQGNKPADTAVIADSNSSINAVGDHNLGQLSFTPTDFSDTTGIVKDLIPGTYQVYGRVQIQPKTGDPVYTTWKNTSATIDPVLALSIPMSTNNFATYQSGEFGKAQNTTFGQIKSGSNQAIKTVPETVTAGTSSDSSVSLVDTPAKTGDLRLDLNAVYGEISQDKIVESPTQTWKQLKLGTNAYSNQLALSPYWNTDTKTPNLASLYVTGNYIQPQNSDPKSVSYNVSFSTSAQ